MASRVSPSFAACVGRHPAGGEAQRVVRRLLLEHGIAQPGIAAEQQMPLRLHERPLAVDPLVQLGLGQQPGAVERRRPQRLDGVPGGSVVVGGRGFTRQPACGVLTVELGLDVRGHVDVVDDETLEVTAEVHVAAVAVDDLQAADLTVTDLQAGKVAQVDAGTAELVGLGVLGSHRGSLARPVPSTPPTGIRPQGATGRRRRPPTGR